MFYQLTTLKPSVEILKNWIQEIYVKTILYLSFNKFRTLSTCGFGFPDGLMMRDVFLSFIMLKTVFIFIVSKSSAKAYTKAKSHRLFILLGTPSL